MPKRGDFFNIKIHRKDEESNFQDKSKHFKFENKWALTINHHFFTPFGFFLLGILHSPFFMQ